LTQEKESSMMILDRKEGVKELTQTKEARISQREFNKRLSEWIERNPLREWRSKEDVTIHQASAMLDVAPSTIQAWEGGAHLPREKGMKILEEITGLEEIHEKWFDWIDEKPKR
jgi:DNA-binding transcriptional regulator YiaG